MAYQVLTQQRPASTSPLAWADASHPTVVPGLGNAGTLSQWYQSDQATKAADKGDTPDQIVLSDLERINNGLKLADEYDAAQGYAPGTSRGKIIDQVVKGDYDDSNKIDTALLDQLNEQFPGIGKDGEEYKFIPKGESFTRKYIVWALRQPEDQRDPSIWSAQDWLARSFDESAERGLVENETGQMELAPEVTPDAPPIDFLNGLGLTRAADGSGEMLTTSPAPSGTVAQPTVTVGGMGGTLYETATTSSQPIIILHPNTPLTTIETRGEWVHVTEPGGLEGWMRKGYLSSAAQSPAAVSAPVATTPVPVPASTAPVASQPLPASVPLPVPPSKRPGGITAPTTTPAPTATATPTSMADQELGATQPAVAPVSTPAPVTTPAFDVVPANDGMGVQSTRDGSDRSWMEFMLGGQAKVTEEYKAPRSGQGHQAGHGAAIDNHAAYDIGLEGGGVEGTPIKSPVAGKVVCSGYGQGTGGSVGGCTYSQNTTSPNSDGSAAAHTIVVEVGRDANGNPIQMSFNHIGTSQLQPGQTINVGDQIGTMGNTPGGPHLHLEAWVGDPASGYLNVDPQLVVGGYYGSVNAASGQPAPAAAPATLSAPVTPRTTPGLTPGDPAPYQPLVQQAAAENGVPPEILSALLQQESQYDPAALSPAGALGIAQFMPATAAGYGIDPLDPRQAIPAAAKYLANAYAQFGSWELALAAYNAGGGAVQQYGGVPPYPETQNYVATIMANAGYYG